MSELQSQKVKKLWQDPKYRKHMQKAHKGMQSPNKGNHYKLGEDFKIKARARKHEKAANWKGGISQGYRVKNLPTRKKPKRCEVCNKIKARICFDHDHKTDKFRGWLCINCNSALGLVNDSISLLRLLIKYLKKNGK